MRVIVLCLFSAIVVQVFGAASKFETDAGNVGLYARFLPKYKPKPISFPSTNSCHQQQIFTYVSVRDEPR